MPQDPQGEPEPTHEDQGFDLLLRFVAQRDVPCPACGYNLRQLSRAVCPECGLALKLSIGSDTPFKRAWAITLCINAMIAGIGVIFLLLMFAAGEAPSHEELILLWFYSPMLLTPAPILLLCFRKAFCKLPTSIQYTAACLSGFWLALIAVTMVLDLN